MTLRLSVLGAIFLGLLYLAYIWVSSFPEKSMRSDPNVPVTASMGEQLFWGKATCHVCHRIGDRGYALRGPNLGESEDGPSMPARSQLRADSLQLDSALDYLIQSISEPAAFVVPGFNNEMPEVFRAPVALFPSEIKAIIVYLTSLEGDSTVPDISLPPNLLASYSDVEDTIGFTVSGNSKEGRSLFFDPQGPAACASCHIGLKAKGGPQGTTIGPDLSAIATIRTGAHLFLKITNPDSNMVSGYRQVLAITSDGLYLSGLLEDETEEALWLRTGDNRLLRLGKTRLAKLIPQSTSMMPGNYAELLYVLQKKPHFFLQEIQKFTCKNSL